MTLGYTTGPVPPDWYFGVAGPDQKLWGPDVASVAGVITLPYRYQRVTGALAITGINAPDGSTLPGGSNFQGTITVIPTGAFTWTTATNIAVAGTAVVNRALDFIYNPITGKWNPSYV